MTLWLCQKRPWNRSFTMLVHDEHWWVKGKADWLNAAMIAAPMMIVFALVLITHRIRSGWSSSRIYTPCMPVYSHYEPVYVPTTCAFDKTMSVVKRPDDEEHAICATGSSVIGDVERGMCDVCSYTRTVCCLCTHSLYSRQIPRDQDLRDTRRPAEETQSPPETWSSRKQSSYEHSLF